MLKNLWLCLPSFILISCATNNVSWMKEKSSYINNKTLGNISMPGSHLANAYDIKKDQPLCIGEYIESKNMSANATLKQALLSSNKFIQESFIQYLTTQHGNITQQLNDGMRYLELQVCKQNGLFYTSNLYLTEQLSDILTKIKDFSEKHSEEIIILDLDNNLWADYGRMNSLDAAKLYEFIIRILGNNLAPNTMLNSTIKQLKESNKQIVLMSSNPQLVKQSYIWNKNLVAITAPPEYPTIKKITLIQEILSHPENSQTISIIPLYSQMPSYNLSDKIDETNTEDSIMITYLSEILANHALVIVTDHEYSNSIINLTISNNNSLSQKAAND